MEIIGNPERLAKVGNTAFDKVTASVPTYEQAWVCGLVRRPAAAVVLPFDREQGYFVLASQARIGALGALVIEAPSGVLEHAGEDALETAKRELQEELGVVAADWTVVATEAYVSPGYSDEKMWLFLAGGLTEVAARAVDAYIEPLRLPLAELDSQLVRYRELAASQDPGKDLKTLALLQALKLELLAG